jgi:hypothetical protein
MAETARRDLRAHLRMIAPATLAAGVGRQLEQCRQLAERRGWADDVTHVLLARGCESRST